MAGMEPRPTQNRAVRVLGWLGLWLCHAAFFALLPVWSLSIRPRLPSFLPAWGSPAFWGWLGLDVLMASLATLRVWAGRNRPIRRRGAASPRLRMMAYLVPILIMASVGALTATASPGGPMNWVILLGGIAALPLLSLLGTCCGKLVLPPRPMESVPWVSSSPSQPFQAPTLVAGGPAPGNPFRAWISATEAVYRRPTWMRVSAIVLTLFFLQGLAACLLLTLLLLLPLPLPGRHPHVSLTVGLILAGGFLFNGGFLLLFLPGGGPEELRLRRMDRTYRLRTTARWRPVFLMGAARVKGLPLPWPVVERVGSADDLAGIEMRVSRTSRGTTYPLYLRWADPTRPRMCVGLPRDGEKAWALQAQIADDLGVPVLGLIS